MKEETHEEKIDYLVDYFKEYILDDVEKGIEGRNIGIPIPLPRLQGIINGVQKEQLILLGAKSGVGKSSFVDWCYVLYPYIYLQSQKKTKGTNTKLKVIYFSLERATRFKIQKWVCAYLFMKYGLIIDLATLNSFPSKLFEITPDIKKKIMSAEKFVNTMLGSGDIEILEGQINPTGIYKHVNKYAEKVGILTRETKLSKEGVEYRTVSYEENDPDLYTIIVIDHLGRLNRESGMSERETIGKMSEYCSMFRDRYKFTPIMVSQFNRGSDGGDRARNGRLEPEPSDFAGSSNIYNDSDLVLSAYNPVKLKVTNALGYEMAKFKSKRGHNTFRAVYVLKNTQGIDDIGIGLHFQGENGIFKELPKPEDKADLEKIYEKLKKE